MTPDDTRNFFQQEDDAWSRALELALTPVVAAGIGYLIDRVVGTVPIFTIVFLVLAVIGTFVKMYYAYDTKMKAHDAESPWGRAQTRGAARAAAQESARAAGASTAKAPKRIRDAAADHAAANRASADHAASGDRASSGADRIVPAADRIVPATGRASADRVTADRPGADRIVPATDRAATEGARASAHADQAGSRS